VRCSPPACRPEVFRFPRSILLLAPGILIAIFLLVNPSNGVADPLPPSKKPRELSGASVVGLKLLKTFTNLPILTFSLGSIRNRWPQIIPLFNRFNIGYDAVPFGILTEVASADFRG
jgi:hypothetical protein